MSPDSWVLMAVLLLCIALSSFFSAAETAYAAASRVRLKAMLEGGERRSARALKLAADYDRLITAILIGNNITNIAGASIATLLFTRWAGSMGATWSTITMTVVILLIGEVAPKTLAKQSPESIAIAFARPLEVTMRLLQPVNTLFSLWRKLLKKLFPPKKNKLDIEDELITMVDEAQQDGGMDAHEGALIRSAIEFVDQDALDIMTPRVDVTAVEDSATMQEAEALFRESGYSRLPVIHEDLDHVVGILNQKDFHAAMHAGEQDLRKVMVPPVYAPASLKISKLLRLCQTTRTHLVVVLDEFGGTEGIVSIEDVLEELVGEIYDENDDVSEELVRLEDGSYQVDGGMPLTELLDQLHVPDKYEADTVGGWAAEVLGRIPAAGASFDVDGLHVVVTAMDKRRVTRVSIRRIAEAEQEQDS